MRAAILTIFTVACNYFGFAQPLPETFYQAPVVELNRPPMENLNQTPSIIPERGSPAPIPIPCLKAPGVGTMVMISGLELSEYKPVAIPNVVKQQTAGIMTKELLKRKWTPLP